MMNDKEKIVLFARCVAEAIAEMLLDAEYAEDAQQKAIVGLVMTGIRHELKAFADELDNRILRNGS